MVAEVEIGAGDRPVAEVRRRGGVVRWDLTRHHIAAGEGEGVGSSRRGRPLARVDAIPCRLIGSEAVVDEGYDLSSRIDRDRDVSIRARPIDVQSRKVDGCPAGAADGAADMG